MPRKARLQAFFQMLLITAMSVFLLAAGFVAGRYAPPQATHRIDRILRGDSVESRLRAVASQAQQREIAQRTLGGVLAHHDYPKYRPWEAYLEPEQAKIALKNYSWVCPQTNVPFLGSACAPGQWDNAFINEQFCRNEKSIGMPKESGVFRVFVTGGSVAYGSGSPSNERTIGGYLELFLNERLAENPSRRFEVFTFACPSWSSTHERIAVENRILEWEPDLVVDVSGNNDFFWSYFGHNTLLFRTFHDAFVEQELHELHAAVGLAPYVKTAQPSARVDIELAANRLLLNAELAARALRLRNATLLFLLQPHLQLTGKKLTERERYIRDDSDFILNGLEGFREYLASGYEISDRKLAGIQLPGFHFRNMTSVFDDESGDVFLDSVHFADRGNKILASAICDEIALLLNQQP